MSTLAEQERKLMELLTRRVHQAFTDAGTVHPHLVTLWKILREAADPVDVRGVAAQPLLRGHRVANSPWWFASSGGGRFDLALPRGTCYLALDEATAIRETVGEAGDASWPVDPSPESFAVAARRQGFTVARPPRSVRIVSPPN
ncbi:RES domain-containing protein [Prescottella sp. R16]|uniref:RES domain-containing protein n=1 Tax=Prescottella sp. R16 TaxID=3064529 RepID=UPI00272E795D|nr:RES domain-containing protein [Prescottella sp. R16]